MASVVEICNRALQIVGEAHITSLSEDRKAARECNLAYEPVRDAEFRKHVWNFAKKRVVLAPDASSPVFGYDYQFSLPSDFLRLNPVDAETDWRIEGRKLLTSDGDTLNLGYIAVVDDPNIMDAAFREAVAAKLAVAVCEPITQSNTKIATAQALYDEAIRDAKRVNAIENPSEDLHEDSWITARL